MSTRVELLTPMVVNGIRSGIENSGFNLQCSRKAKAGLLYCQFCSKKMRQRRMLRQPLFCPECKKLIRPEERNRNRFHKLCAEMRRARREPPTHRSAALAYQQRHRALGLCIICTKKGFKGGLCREHYGKVLERYYERAAG